MTSSDLRMDIAGPSFLGQTFGCCRPPENKRDRKKALAFFVQSDFGFFILSVSVVSSGTPPVTIESER